MCPNNINDIFDSYLNKKSFFREKSVLQSAYTPESIVHRDNEITQIAKILAPCLRNERPSNLFLYGKTGTGKTLVAKFTSTHILKKAEENKVSVKIIYLNCKLSRVADTEYRLIAQLAREFGKAIPPTGLPTDEVYNIFFRAVDEEKKVIILVLDEIDQLVKKAGDEIIYNLTRINSELKNAQISLVGISNDLLFTDNLDPRVKSSLSEEEIVFPPYNALQIQEILRKRSLGAFFENVIQAGVIEKCAAYAAREHGDARRALELLRVAGEIAERNSCENVLIEHIDMAEEKIERDRVIDIVNTQPKQQQATLYSILQLYSNNSNQIYTGEVYEVYKSLCLRCGLRPLTQRRVSDVIAELDMLGIINAKIISKGRYGRTREVSLSVEENIMIKLKEIIEKALQVK